MPAVAAEVTGRNNEVPNVEFPGTRLKTPVSCCVPCGGLMVAAGRGLFFWVPGRATSPGDVIVRDARVNHTRALPVSPFVRPSHDVNSGAAFGQEDSFYLQDDFSRAWACVDGTQQYSSSGERERTNVEDPIRASLSLVWSHPRYPSMLLSGQEDGFYLQGDFASTALGLW
jgi:hypothetical protein